MLNVARNSKTMTQLFRKIKNTFPVGTIIPRPKKNTIVISYGFSGNFEYLCYRIGSDNKGEITEMDFDEASFELIKSGKLTRSWFVSTGNPKPCDYTTLGGIFILLSMATYKGKGIYLKS